MGESMKKAEDIAAAIEAIVPPREPRATAVAVEASPAEVEQAIPMATAAQLIATVEKLFERVDKGEKEASSLLQQVLDQHGLALKKMLSPDNRMHPDISDYNPRGERDHPRPPLKRPCFFLGVPLEQPSLTYDEIELLNSIPGPLELKDKNWRVAFLRDGGGGEALYISVPYRGFDDLRSIDAVGGWQGVLRQLTGIGSTPVSQDSLLERIAALEATLRAQHPTISISS